VAVSFHPSFLVEADIKTITDVPVAIYLGTQDDMMSVSALDGLSDVLSANLGERYEAKKIEDAVHGFAVRGDDLDEKEKGHKEEGNRAAIAFVKKWFGA
jgi:predicted esterase